MRILKLDIQKMRHHRYKHQPHFKILHVDFDIVATDMFGVYWKQFVEDFMMEMRGRRVWNPKEVEYDVFQDYDIDFNRYKWGISERFLPERRDA